MTDIETNIDPLFENIPDDHRSGFVAVVGRPNAGKSTLLNTFMEQKIAIVTPRPQTTRTRQLGILTTPNYQMVFMDTPGIIKKARHKLDEYMVQTALETFADADVITVIGTNLAGCTSLMNNNVLVNLNPEPAVQNITTADLHVLVFLI